MRFFRLIDRAAPCRMIEIMTRSTTGVHCSACTQIDFDRAEHADCMLGVPGSALPLAQHPADMIQFRWMLWMYYCHSLFSQERILREPIHCPHHFDVPAGLLRDRV